MMKKQLFNFKNLAIFVCLGLLSFSSLAQTQVGNSGFENWDNTGTDNEEPTNWNSFMTANCTLGSFMCNMGQKQRVERSTDAHSGSYSARIWSTSTIGIVANGNMTLGRVHMGSATANDPSNYNYTDVSDPDFNQAFTGKPDSLVAWVKYNPVTSTDKARISATIHNANNYRDPDDGSATSYVVAKAVKNYPTTNSQWKRISIPFDYIGPSTDAQYILVTFTTNMTPGGGNANDEVFVDDLQMIYNTPTVAIAPVAVQNLVEGQSGSTLTATEVGNAANPTASGREWKYSTTSGSGYQSFGTPETGTTYTPQFTTAGTYYVVCESTFGGTAYTSNEVKVVVTPYTITIAPTAVQNLVENQSGNTLSVNESPTATSREWKYSTTSGSGYQSFGTPETGTTYTPQFATAGTYYVVCESTFGGNTATSNEVEIDVTAPVSNGVSIAPNSVQNLIENQAGTTISASETPNPANSREWKYSMTSGSGYQSFGTPETGTTYTPQFATAGTYYVVCVSDFGGGDIQTSNEVEIDVSTFTNSIAASTTQNLIETQAGTDLTVTETPTADSREWKYSTTSGSGYQSFGTPETGATYTPQFATAGTYYVVCESTIDGITVTSNEVEIDVSTFTNPIAASTTQNLIETQAGTDLTVTETPTADSREWKYSTTSGSGYQSFGTPETGATYTPQFATAGTYYVVCESTIDGITVTSNEVEIDVVAFTATIAPNTDQNLNENEAGTDLTVTETPTADSREWKYSTTSGSGYQSFGTPETGMTYTPQFATAGTYYVVCESTIDGITVTSNEVKIVVDQGAGVITLTKSSVHVYSTKQGLTVDLSNSNMKNPSLRVIGMDGRIVAQQSLKSNTKNSVQLHVVKGIYVYAVIGENTIEQGKVYLR